MVELVDLEFVCVQDMWLEGEKFFSEGNVYSAFEEALMIEIDECGEQEEVNVFQMINDYDEVHIIKDSKEDDEFMNMYFRPHYMELVVT